MAGPLSSLDGFVAEGDVWGVEAAMRHGRHPVLVNPLNWPAPEELEAGDGPERIGITDELIPVRAGIALLRPPSLTLGVSIAVDVDPESIGDLVVETLAEAHLARSSVVVVATEITHARHPGIEQLGIAVLSLQASELTSASRSAGTDPCETAALLAAGPTGRLLSTRRLDDSAMVAVARRMQPVDLRDVSTSTSLRMPSSDIR